MRGLINIVFLCFFGLLSCKSVQKEAPPELLLSIEKTPCYGTCPAYKFAVFNNRRATYVGGAHAPRQGSYELQLTEADIQELQGFFDKAHFFELNDNYASALSDLPTTYFYLKQKEKKKTISGYGQVPEALKKLEAELEQWIEAREWKLANRKE